MNYLLPTDSLLEVVGSLVTHDLLSIRRKALDLLATKLQQLEPDSLRKSDVSFTVVIFRMVIYISEILSWKKSTVLCIVCLSDMQVKSLIQLVDLLTNIAEDDSGGKDGEFVNCRQHALFSLKLICRLLAHQHPRHFVKVLIKFHFQSWKLVSWFIHTVCLRDTGTGTGKMGCMRLCGTFHITQGLGPIVSYCVAPGPGAGSCPGVSQCE